MPARRKEDQVPRWVYDEDGHKVSNPEYQKPYYNIWSLLHWDYEFYRPGRDSEVKSGRYKRHEQASN